MILYLLPDFPLSQGKFLHNLTTETKFGKQNQECVKFQKKKNYVMLSLEPLNSARNIKSTSIPNSSCELVFKWTFNILLDFFF